MCSKRVWKDNGRQIKAQLQRHNAEAIVNDRLADNKYLNNNNMTFDFWNKRTTKWNKDKKEKKFHFELNWIE